ncbi:MAG: type II secretion system F family protein [Candidatus Aureabacteria bacterium]|nr:type II secretion system F family protein [Candidatus Auribacterota bacterium]
MPKYKYTVKAPDGRSIQGFMDARNEGDVIEELKKKSLMIISVERARKAPIKQTRKKVKSDELVVFTRQLSTMISAGLPLLQALVIQEEQTDNLSFKTVIKEVQTKVESGASLSEAMIEYPKVFTKLYVSMIRVGEASGMFAEILERVATYLEEANALRRKVKSAMIYPAVVSAMAVLITVVLLMKVVPVFEEVFESFGAKLPAPTQFLINVSHLLRDYFVYVFVGLIAAIFAVRAWAKTPIGRYQCDSFILRMPIFGTILKKVVISRFTKTLGVLIKSGVPLLNSLEVVESVAGNAVVETAIRNASVKISAGEGVAEPLGEAKIFPSMVVRMIGVGEKTGKLDLMLEKIAQFYDDEVNAAVNGLTSIIEPLLIAFLGIVVGGIVICMFMPIFKLSSIVNA